MPATMDSSAYAHRSLARANLQYPYLVCGVAKEGGHAAVVNLVLLLPVPVDFIDQAQGSLEK